MLVAIIVFAGLLGACAPKGLPEGWPAEWDGREFADTSAAFVYADSSSARDEAAGIAARLAVRFQDRAGRPPRKGVIVVVDEGEEPPIVDAQLQQAGSDVLKDIAEHAGQTSASPGVQRVLARAGELTRLVAAGSWGRRLEFAGDVPERIRAEAPYVLVLPSSRATIGAFDDVVRAALAETGATWPQRTALKAAIDLARPDFLGTVRDLHRRTVIATMVGSDETLTATQRSGLDALVAELAPRPPTLPGR